MAGRKSQLTHSKSVSNLSPIRQHGLEVEITGYEEMDGGAYVNFVLEIKKEGLTWELRKRYSEFRFFQQALAEHLQILATEFPPKTVGRLGSDQLEKRKNALNRWFNDFLDNVAMSPSIQNQLYAFLRVHENTGPDR